MDVYLTEWHGTMDRVFSMSVTTNSPRFPPRDLIFFVTNEVLTLIEIGQNNRSRLLFIQVREERSLPANCSLNRRNLLRKNEHSRDIY